MPSGYLGGRYDLVVQRFVDGWMAFPGLLVLLTVMSIVGRGTLQIIVVLGVLYGIHNSRVLRSAVIGIKENDYIATAAAAAAVGNGRLRTVLRHVLPQGPRGAFADRLRDALARFNLVAGPGLRPVSAACACGHRDSG